MESRQKTDPSQNFLGRIPQPLDALFYPKTVALIGAKDDKGSVGRTIQSNLMNGSFDGKIYPVNPKRDEVLGLKAYPSIKELEEAVDLAVIVTPAKTVPGIIAECVEAKTRSSIIISAGFKEIGEEGVKREREILKLSKEAAMPIIGPNCLGVMNPVYGLNATFAKGMAKPGNIAFISQSGAMCTAVLDWSFQENIGFSVFVSIGSMMDVDWGDLIQYLGSDPHTDCILIYMETIGDPRSFLSAAREAALEKPIIVIKPGRTEKAAQAAASHTGSMTGSDDVFEAALERVGVLRVETISDLFDMAALIAGQPKPEGPSLGIITNAGGPSVLATDAAITHGAEIGSLSEESLSALNDFLPEAWSRHNPVDLLGDANAEDYRRSAEVLLKDPGINGLLAILTPQDMTEPTETARELSTLAGQSEKPLLTSWMGGESILEGSRVLARAGIPSYEYPDEAAAAFATLWKWRQLLDTLYEVPAVTDSPTTEAWEEEKKRIDTAGSMIAKARKENRNLLNEEESKKILELYGIPTVKTLSASSEEEAASIAEEIGYPVVVKLFSKTITHKTDVGGVKLNLQSKTEVVEAFRNIKRSTTEKKGAEHFQGVTVQKMIKTGGIELILGSTLDPQFGPVILFGSGGKYVEVYRDRALGIPPLTDHLAAQMMKKTKIYKALEGVRGEKAVDLEHLAEILIHFSQMVADNREIKEFDINPLLASPEGFTALDARVVLMEEDEAEPPLAMRPYPLQYCLDSKLKDGTSVAIRPIKPEDETLLHRFHKDLSEESVRNRYFSFLSLNERTAHQRLVKICFNDYVREIALVAEIPEKQEVIGVARLTRIPATPQAEMRLIIADAYHRKGLGRQLIEQLIHIGKKEGIALIRARILSENEGMISLCEKLGFKTSRQDEIVMAELALSTP